MSHQQMIFYFKQKSHLINLISRFHPPFSSAPKPKMPSNKSLSFPKIFILFTVKKKNKFFARKQKKKESNGGGK